MAAMKDLTPVYEGDFVLKEKERLGFSPQAEQGAERLNLVTEERMERKRALYEASVPVAHDILEEARSALAVHFRFLDQALWRMPLEPSFDMYGIASDGVRLVYDPVYVVDRFKISPNGVVRDVLHCLFHCIFRHPFMLYSVLRQVWDVSCDIAIEAMLLDLVGEAFPSNFDRRAREALKFIRTQIDGPVTAERLYWFFSNDGSHIDLVSLSPMFRHDLHGLWYGAEEEQGRGDMEATVSRDANAAPPEGAPAQQSLETEQLDAVSDGPVAVPRPETEEEEAASPSDSSGENESPADGAESDAGGSQPDALPGPTPEERERAQREWEDVSRRMQVELETHLARQGEGAGNLIVGLAALNREKHDYGEFLRRFATLHERMKVNDNEFDYIYYTYGLKRYGNMPLIEPLEYKEDRQVHDFAIAIDTSESCSGAVVQAFMRKTYNILKQQESFNNRVNVHIIQCDAQVQEDTKITSLEQLELYLEDFELKGFGGTDFRPVFDYVDLLIEKGEFTDLRGLVYFTDGEGTFPRRAPRYDAVFAFLDDGYSDPPVPPWALKVILDERDLEER